ncbi:hypothetical protein GBA52_010964 [Prunus armeniaca]|nr:hypothetical protein GBA52_010964 [Prunus armeniaca]
MTTGRINQVAFLSDVGSVQDKRPCGSSARRGHDTDARRRVKRSELDDRRLEDPTPRNAQITRSQAKKLDGSSQSHARRGLIGWRETTREAGTSAEQRPRKRGTPRGNNR